MKVSARIMFVCFDLAVVKASYKLSRGLYRLFNSRACFKGIKNTTTANRKEQSVCFKLSQVCEIIVMPGCI